MNKKWEVSEINEEEINKIAEENNISVLLASILYQRRNKKQTRSTNFFKPYQK